MQNYINWFNSMGEERVRIIIEGYEAIDDDTLIVWGVVKFNKNDEPIPDLTGK